MVLVQMHLCSITPCDHLPLNLYKSVKIVKEHGGGVAFVKNLHFKVILYQI